MAKNANERMRIYSDKSNSLGNKIQYILALLVSHLGSLLKIPCTLKIEKLN